MARSPTETTLAADSVANYRAKQDFGKTAEPSGATRPTPGNGFLVQKHEATRLHYDFRLEIDGVLLSWAVTRGPSLDPDDKRLPVRTEDHPLDYATFEWTIPKGQYGGGTVMLWDNGTWESIAGKAQPDRFTAALAKDKRTGRIFVDYLRDQRGATAVMPYSARARENAPVAVPITWEALSSLECASRWHVCNAAELLKRVGSKDLIGWGRADQLLPDL